MTVAAAKPKPTEDVPGDFDVTAFRFERLVEAGFPVPSALLLAENSDVDWHRAADLLRRGATVEEAIRILT